MVGVAERGDAAEPRTLPGHPRWHRLALWMLVGGIGAVALAVDLLALWALTGWPEPRVVLAAAVPPLAALGAARLGWEPETHLRAAVTVLAVVVLVSVVFLVIVPGLGVPLDDEGRQIVGACLVAAGIAALLTQPVREWAQRAVTDLVGSDRTARTDPSAGISARMSRALPLEELLLGTAEQVRVATADAVELWTGEEGQYALEVSVPTVHARALTLDPAELDVVTRARLGGTAWTGTWLPALLREGGEDVRVAPLAHLGHLYGLLVVRREAHRGPLPEAEEASLVEVARQLGLALHNARLDSALQRSLVALRGANEELRASRLRLVGAADESRRAIERDLHDGAQQRLVALAVQLSIAQTLLDSDPEAAREVLGSLRSQVQEIVREVRELAHGIYPPLLRTRGLAAAVGSAATRCSLPVSLISAETLGRFTPEVESAVYFCCVEALANAGKHAGAGAQVRVALGVDAAASPGGSGVTHGGEVLWFEVADDGVGSPAVIEPGGGHGLTNMADRLGALGGSVTAGPAPDGGWLVRGVVPGPERAEAA